MTHITRLLEQLGRAWIAERIYRPHDAARASYASPSDRLHTFDEYIDALAAFCRYHVLRCDPSVTALSQAQAATRATQVIQSQYHPGGGDIRIAWYHAAMGIHGGLAAQLDVLATALRKDAAEHHVRILLDRYRVAGGMSDCSDFIERLLAHMGR